MQASTHSLSEAQGLRTQPEGVQAKSTAQSVTDWQGCGTQCCVDGSQTSYAGQYASLVQSGTQY
jgi:hypothetical protein